MKSAVVLATSLLTSSAWAITAPSKKLVPPPLRKTEPLIDGKIQKRDTDGQGVFQQLLDHSDPSLGTFNQSFWWSTEFWQGPGSPVVFFTPGEVAAYYYTGYLTNETITGQFAQAIGGAVVMMEHRYWGESSPYSVLSTENLTYLTLDNAILDTTYFANNVKLPFDSNGTSNAANAPWVFSGGSYSGALSAWTESVAPGTFWAYHASSAVVEAIYDFWEYFDPVAQGMPQNCSTDVKKVISYVDGILLGNDTSAKQALKEQFGLSGLKHDDDFASVLENGPWLWQSNQFYTGYSSFYAWCDTIENVGSLYPNATTVPGAEGVGLEKALDGYATWVSEYLVPGYCESYGYQDFDGEYNLECFDSYNASSPIYTDWTMDNVVDRQWEWLLCNEPFAFWQDGAAYGTPSIVSSLVSAEYWQRQCPLYFPGPGTVGSEDGKNVSATNTFTKGWDIAGTTTRLIFTNGQYDPWKDATVSSDFKPGGPYNGTADAPVQVIPDGIHCSDMIAENGVVNAGVQAAIDNEISVISNWVEEYYTEKKKRRVVRRS
ncbi:putative serine protease EDA2 [Cytospora mali]|uniref:Serine protease EDA2 n=1 Tax=Cytospora mali TaxID=578113 RepID=A0A194VC50_CYTMA|nr:putative serine protease EDA2 [Valsa mali var. pyri (nom. inval.)]